MKGIVVSQTILPEKSTTVVSISSRHRGRSILLIALLLMVLVGTSTGILLLIPKGTLGPAIVYPIAPTGPRPTVLLIHGYGFFNACPADDGAQKWGTVVPFLHAHGWQDIQTVGYYSCDTNQDVYIDNFGRFPETDSRNHAEYYATSPCACASHKQAEDGRLSHTKDTDIRHLAYHLAWYIWDTYAQFSQPVDIVAHSMAGLIVRWMLYAMDNPQTVGQGLFPPRVFVPQVVTLSAPNAGISVIGEVVPTYQAKEMRPDSAFMQEVNAQALDPQGAGDTDWTLIGNYPADRDLVVTAASATAMDHVHRIVYFDASTYTHNDILNDASTVLDARVYRCDNCFHTVRISNGGFSRYDDMPHSLNYINAALLSDAW
jgi:hypothetical protein